MKVVISRQIKELRRNALISITVPTIMSGSREGVRGIQPPPPLPSLFKIQISFKYIVKLPEYASNPLAISKNRRTPPPIFDRCTIYRCIVPWLTRLWDLLIALNWIFLWAELVLSTWRQIATVDRLKEPTSVNARKENVRNLQIFFVVLVNH